MRGGTSKGLYFNAADLPADIRIRDRVLVAAMGSPDPRQTDGVGGGHPLTSKVAIIGPPTHPQADVDYLFLQVNVGEAVVTDNQNCGNILAGVGPWAIERGLVNPLEAVTPVRIHMLNTKTLAVARVSTPNRRVEYDGDERIDGVYGTAAAIPIEFVDTAGSTCGSLLPTGKPVEILEGVAATCIDNGMPVVLLNAADFGLTGSETPAVLEADAALRARIECIRLAAGRAMGLGDVTAKSIPKMCLVSPARNGGSVATRTFIPHRVHESIGVLGAVSVATACVLPGAVGHAFVSGHGRTGLRRIVIEHPTGSFAVDVDVRERGGVVEVTSAALLRTARKLMDGTVYVPGWALAPGGDQSPAAARS